MYVRYCGGIGARWGGGVKLLTVFFLQLFSQITIQLGRSERKKIQFVFLKQCFQHNINLKISSTSDNVKYVLLMFMIPYIFQLSLNFKPILVQFIDITHNMQMFHKKPVVTVQYSLCEIVHDAAQNSGKKTGLLLDKLKLYLEYELSILIIF